MKKQNAIFKPVDGFKKARWYRSPLLVLIIATGLAVGSCKTIYVPVPGQSVVEYRDSVVTKLDTLKVEVKNTEYIRDWTGLLDTLSLSAEGGKIQSRAWVDTTKAMLVGELETKPREVDVIVPHTLEYHQKDSTSIEPIIIEEVETKYKTPRWAWYSLVLNIIGLLLTGFGVYLKLKKKFPL